jgi:hypothetical protein
MKKEWLLLPVIICCTLLLAFCHLKKKEKPTGKQQATIKTNFDSSYKYSSVCLSVQGKPVFSLGDKLKDIAPELTYKKSPYQQETKEKTNYYFDYDLFTFRYPKKTDDPVTGKQVF